MNQNTTTDHHLVAIDISKDSLQVHTGSGENFSIAYDKAGLGRLLKHLRRLPDPFVVCEATGSYERPLLAMLHEAHVAVKLINPARLRAFALSEAVRAKTDRIDARMILRFAQEKHLQPAPPPDPVRQQLADLLDRRSHLTGQLAREKNRLQKCQKTIAASIRRMIRFVEKELCALDARIKLIVARDRLLSSQAQIFQSVKGVGEITAWTLLAYLSEMAHLQRNQLVALAGIAPFNRDSGKSCAKRSIHAGRSKVRKCLYMAAHTAAQHNPVIKPYVAGLIARGKPYKCAIVAAMRKLLIHLHSLLKHQQIVIAL